jgi:hypothetical protein
MLETLLKITGVLRGWCEEWLLVFYHYYLPYSSTKHTAVMFAVTVSWPCLLTNMWYQASISSELYIQSHAVLLVSQLLCKSVFKTDNYILQEYANSHLIFSEAHGNGAAAVTYPECRHFSHQRLLHQGDWYCLPFYTRPWKMEKCMNSWYGRAYVEMHTG